MTDTVDFFLGSLEVGIFTAPFPQQNGLHCYEPYRGPGHFDLMESLRDGSVQRCYYDVGEQRFHFTVIGCPGYAVLELTEFDTPAKAD